MWVNLREANVELVTRMRGIERVLGFSCYSFGRLLFEHLTCLPLFRSLVLAVQTDEVFELDKLWSFFGHKDQKRWLWVAFNRRTQQVLAFLDS